MRDLIFLITRVAATGAFSMAERSYPTAEVRGRSLEDPMPKGRRPRGVTPRPKSGAAAESARLRRRRNGGKEQPHIQGQGWRLRGATLHPRPGAVAGRTYPMLEARGRSWEEQPYLQGAVAVRAQEGLEELFTFKVRRGSDEKIPLIQGKEQQLRFAGAAVKRYPTSKVRETQVRW